MVETVMRVAGDGNKAITRRVAFTQGSVERFACPAGKDRVWLYDVKQPGLALMVTRTGSKAFYVYRKVKGRPQRYRIGAFPDIGVDQARTQAKATVGDIAKGIDPQASKKAARAKGLTLGGLWDWFLEHHAKPRKRSWRDDENRYTNHLKPWASKRLDDITQPDVTALHHRVAKKTSQPTANRVLALLSTMFNKAPQVGWTGPNPCRGVSKFAEASRERYLRPDEMGAFLTALEAPDTSNDWRDFFKLCLFSGGRRGNVLSMRWHELDLTAGRWTIPASKFKNKKASTVYLSALALEVLKGRQANGSEWVFPGPGKSGHLVWPEGPWKALCTRAGVADLRIHDLRRTLGSWQAAGGASLPVIGKSLGHKSVQATAVYARLDLDPVRASVDAATAAMLAAGAKTEDKPTATAAETK